MQNNLFKDETLAEKLVKKGFWLYVFVFLTAPTGYIIKVIVSNDLSVGDVGLLYSIISFVMLISVYNDLGLTQSLKYFLPRYWIEKKYNFFKTAIFFSLGIQLITGILIASLLFFGSNYLAMNYFQDPNASNILKLFCLYFLGINIYQVISTIYDSFQDVFQSKLLEFIRMWSVAIFSIFFFLGDFNNVYYYAIAWLSGLFISILIGISIFYKKYKKEVFYTGKIEYNKEMIKNYSTYAFWIFLTANAGVLLGQIDQQMIVYMLGTEPAGYYSNYLSLLQLVSILISPILGTLLMPIAVEFISKKNFGKIKLIQDFFYKYFGVFALSFGIFLAIMGAIIATVLFGDKFTYSGELLIYSGFFIVFNILYGINFPILQAWGEVKFITKVIIITAILNIVLNYLLITNIGIEGAIIATIVGWIFMWYLSFKKINSKVKVNFNFIYFLKNFILFIILGLFLYFVSKQIFILENQYRYTNLLYLIVLGLLYYGIIAIFNYKEIVILKKEVYLLRK